jgi:hypothetical protein
VRALVLIVFVLILKSGLTQVTNTAVMDTSDYRYQEKVTVEGYLDLCFPGRHPTPLDFYRFNLIIIM